MGLVIGLICQRRGWDPTKGKDRRRGTTLILPCIMRGATILASFNARVLLRAMGILHGTTI